MKVFKGRAAERAMAVSKIIEVAQVETIQNINVDWAVKVVNGKDELVPLVTINYRKKGGLLSD